MCVVLYLFGGWIGGVLPEHFEKTKLKGSTAGATALDSELGVVEMLQDLDRERRCHPRVSGGGGVDLVPAAQVVVAAGSPADSGLVVHRHKAYLHPLGGPAVHDARPAEGVFCVLSCGTTAAFECSGTTSSKTTPH